MSDVLDEEGKLILLLERSKKVLTRTVTAKAEQKAIREDDFVSPAGKVEQDKVKNSTFLFLFQVISCS